MHIRGVSCLGNRPLNPITKMVFQTNLPLLCLLFPSFKQRWQRAGDVRWTEIETDQRRVGKIEWTNALIKQQRKRNQKIRRKHTNTIHSFRYHTKWPKASHSKWPNDQSFTFNSLKWHLHQQHWWFVHLRHLTTEPTFDRVGTSRWRK